jgi:hypothetical protein
LFLEYLLRPSEGALFSQSHEGPFTSIRRGEVRRMKKCLMLVFPLLVALVLVPAVSGVADEFASNFWTYITETNPYTGWGYWPGKYGMYPGKSPHGAYLKVFANGVALKAAREGRPMPDGAILVKENYGDDQETLMAVTPMYKVQGYYPAGGNWWWAKFGPDGKAMASGQVKGCINCHSAQKANDWIFTQAE